jgi:hypothetical protein
MSLIVESKLATRSESFGEVGDATTLVTGAEQRKSSPSESELKDAKNVARTSDRVTDQFTHPDIIASYDTINTSGYDFRSTSRTRRY